MRTFLAFLFLVFVSLIPVQAQQSAFEIIPLGVKGGSDESNLSSYMVAPANSDQFVCLDAGTLYAGIRKSIANGLFNQSINRVLNITLKAT